MTYPDAITTIKVINISTTSKSFFVSFSCVCVCVFNLSCPEVYWAFLSKHRSYHKWPFHIRSPITATHFEDPGAHCRIQKLLSHPGNSRVGPILSVVLLARIVQVFKNGLSLFSMCDNHSPGYLMKSTLLRTNQQSFTVGANRKHQEKFCRKRR